MIRRFALVSVLIALVLASTSCSSPKTKTTTADAPAPESLDTLTRARMSAVSLAVETGHNSDSFGAGVVLDDKGHIVTASHVVDGAQRITVLLEGAYTTNAEVIADDPVSDLAVLRCAYFYSDRMLPAKPASETPKVGDPVISIGNPFGTSRFDGNDSVSTGVVSATHRSYHNSFTGRLYLDCIQHSAPTNPGNSGGGVFNERGEWIGLNVLITTMREIASDSGVAFALPARQVIDSAKQLLDDGQILHPWLGAQEFRLASATNSDGSGRLRVVFGPLDPNGPAARIGIQPGDVLVSVNGKPVFGLHETLMAENALTIGDKALIVIQRAGRKMDFNVIVAQRTVD